MIDLLNGMYSSHSAGGWLQMKASTCCNADCGPLYASKNARRNACGPPCAHASKAVPCQVGGGERE